MNRNRLGVTCLAIASLMWPIVAPAQTPPKESAKPTGGGPQDILSAVPGDAWAVLCAPNIGKTDARLTTMIQRLNLPMMPGNPLMIAKAMMGLTMGFDDSGALAVVVMPVADLTAFAKSMVILLPTSDFDQLMSVMNPEPMEGGISKIYFLDKESYVARHGKWTAMAQTPETLAGVLKSKTSAKSRFNKHQMKRFQSDDLTLWLNASAITSSDLFAAFAPMLVISSADPEMLKQFSSLEVSLRFDPSGLNLGYYIDAAPESDMGKSFRAAPATTESLLTGLPSEPFVLAAGMAASESQSRLNAESVDKMLTTKGAQGGPEVAAVLEGLRPMIKYLIGSIRHLSMSIAPLRAGPNGMIGMTVVLTTEGDSKKVCTTIGEMIDRVKKGLAENEDAAEILNLVEYKAGAEKSGTVQVDHLMVSYPSEGSQEWREQADKILGAEGVLFRIAAVGDKRVAIAFGGGSERFAAVVKAARLNKASLADDEGIKRVSAFVPKKRSSEGYIAVDRLVRMIGEIAKVGDFPWPVVMPEINAPIAMVSAPAGKAGLQNDLFIPMEVIVAAKDAAMNAMAQRMTPPPPPDGEL